MVADHRGEYPHAKDDGDGATVTASSRRVFDQTSNWRDIGTVVIRRGDGGACGWDGVTGWVEGQVAVHRQNHELCVFCQEYGGGNKRASQGLGGRCDDQASLQCQ